MRKINPDIVFLSGVIVMCFGFLLFHIHPYVNYFQGTEFEQLMFVRFLLSRPIGLFSTLLGGVLIFKSLKK